MPGKYDKRLGAYRDRDDIVPEYAADPASGIEGQEIINTTSNQLKIFYAGIWQVVATLTGAGNSFLLLEDSFYLLLENGDKLILE